MNIITNEKLGDFFYQRLHQLVEDPRFSFVDDTLEYYLTNLLQDFGSSEQFFGIGETVYLDLSKPVAILFQQAIEDSPDRALSKSKKLGDWLLLANGIFPEALTGRKQQVNSDYYVNMGKMAYLQASKIINKKRGGEDFSRVYNTLSYRFEDLSRLCGMSIQNHSFTD